MGRDDAAAAQPPSRPAGDARLELGLERRQALARLDVTNGFRPDRGHDLRNRGFVVKFNRLFRF